MPKILLIDDDENLRNVTQSFLEGRGWSFRAAPDAASGLEFLAQERPDILLLDVGLPDMDGFAVAARIKRDPATRTLPIVLISGDRKKAEDIITGLGDGVQGDGYLLKPVSLPVLAAKLDAVLRQNRI